MYRKFYQTLPVLFVAVFSNHAFAQARPDAGQTLQENKEPLKLPATPTPITIESLEREGTEAGGASVTIKSVIIKGNSVIDTQVLFNALGDVQNKSMTLGEIKDLAVKITNHYRKNGYPFAKAIIPAQEISQGDLTIEVFEGRYGEIRLVGDKLLTDRIVEFTEPLKTGEVIANAPLERVTQIIDDLPGIAQVPIIRPSKILGAGDLVIDIKPDKRVNGTVSLNNHGNSYTGRVQSSVGVDINRVLTVGDQLSVYGMLSEENMYLSNLRYERPVYSKGLRANAGYTHSYYQLKKEFSYLEASGRANIFSAGLSYPIIKSQNRNMPIALSVSHKRLADQQKATQVKEYKSVNALALNLSADNRDRFLGNGITYGTLGVTLGNLSMDNALESVDKTTADTAGKFLKYTLNIARVQVLPAGFLFSQEFALQFASKNLDSSEGFGLGGTNGVRAYPSGEGYGDEGFTSQSELRYSLKNLAPFIFFDFGRSRINHSNYSTAKNHRDIAGTGAGVRGNYKELSGNIIASWRTQGGPAQSYSKSYVPMFWMEAEYKF